MADTKKLKHWGEVFKEWEGSEISQKRFCKEREIGYSLFCYWRKQLHEHSMDKPIEVACFEVRNLQDIDHSVQEIQFETEGIGIAVGASATMTVRGRITIGALTRLLVASRNQEAKKECDGVPA
jgi:hypothetical protein